MLAGLFKLALYLVGVAAGLAIFCHGATWFLRMAGALL